MIKSLKQTKKTTQITLNSESDYEISNNMALALLLGSYNSMRKYSINDKPIDSYKLHELQTKFRNLLFEVENAMSVNIREITKL